MSEETPDQKLAWDRLRKEIEQHGPIRNQSIVVTLPREDPIRVLKSVPDGIPLPRNIPTGKEVAHLYYDQNPKGAR